MSISITNPHSLKGLAVRLVTKHGRPHCGYLERWLIADSNLEESDGEEEKAKIF